MLLGGCVGQLWWLIGSRVMIKRMAEKSASFRVCIHTLAMIGPISESAVDGKDLSSSHRIRWTIYER